MSKEISDLNLCRMLNGVAENLREVWLNAQSGGDHKKIMTLTVCQHRLLRMVRQMNNRSNGGVMLKDLAKKLNLSSSAVSVMVDNLVRRGILLRVIRPKDRRKVMISLSEEQLELTDRAEGEMVSLMNDFKVQCPPEKMRCFEEVLSDLDNFLISRGACRERSAVKNDYAD